MASIGFDGIGNVVGLGADIRTAGQDITRKAGRVVRDSAADLQSLGKRNAAVRTGELRASISTTLLGQLEAEVGPEAEHGRWVEHGTSRMSPQPFMGPAADVVEPQFVAALLAAGDPFAGPRG